MPDSSIDSLITCSLEKHRARLAAIADEIWGFAEPRFEEVRSARLLAAFLEEQGFTIEWGAGGLETAFIATAGSGGATLGFLGEYDALPNMSQEAGCAEEKVITPNTYGHGCGHNLLGVGAAAAAIAVRDALAERGLPGTVCFYGCPAEEGGGGKVIMLEGGAFDRLDAALTWHPSDRYYVSSASTLATKTTDFTFYGRSSHAAMSPEVGRSALDAVELMNIAVNYLREHVPQEVRMHYAIIDGGGVAPNVVQAKAVVRYQLRAPKQATVDEVYERVLKIAQGAALMTETRFETTGFSQYRNVLPNFTLGRCLQKQFDRCATPAYPAAERDYALKLLATTGGGTELPERLPVQPYNEQRPVHSASTDVGDVSWKVPTVEARVATWVSGTRAHTWQVVSIGKSQIAHDATFHASQVLAGAAFELFTTPALLTEAKAELEKRLAAERA